MQADYTISWLTIPDDDQLAQLLVRIQEARASHRQQDAIRLCREFIKKVEAHGQHAHQGIIACQLGEIFRLLGPHHYQDALEAFGQARMHFTLAGGQPGGLRNEGIAYWSMGMVLEHLPGEWSTALRHYQSALGCIEQELDEAETRSSLPKADRDQLFKDLKSIHVLLKKDHETLLRHETLGDPKIVGLLNRLADTEDRLASTEKRLHELTDKLEQLLIRTEKASMLAAKAAEQAMYSARAAGAAQNAIDAISRKTTLAARLIEAAVQRLEALQAKPAEPTE